MSNEINGKIEDIFVPFGLANITIDGNDMGLQGDAAVFTAEPEYIEIDTYEMGVYDLYLDRWNVNLSVTFQDENFKKLKMALPALNELKDEDGEVVGLEDGATHQRMRNRAVEINITPRDGSPGVSIYKAYPVGVFERTYGKDIGSYQVEFKGLPISGNPHMGGNYFRIGDEGIKEDEDNGNGEYNPED